MLTTRVLPSGGSAIVAGIDVVANPTLAKQLIGVVSQQNTLDRQLTVWENLYFHGRLFGISKAESRQTATDLLDRFQLARWANASVYALSGGMAQRLMVARAIFHRPAVLFLDEPTAGLDPQSRLALWELMGELNTQGQTIVLTTHYMEEAEQLCDRVAIIDHGHLLTIGTPEELTRSIRADTVVTVRSSGDPTALLAAIEASIGPVERSRTTDGALEIYVAGVDRLVPRIVEAVDVAGLEIADLQVTVPTLESVFIALTGKELRDE